MKKVLLAVIVLAALMLVFFVVPVVQWMHRMDTTKIEFKVPSK